MRDRSKQRASSVLVERLTFDQLYRMSEPKRKMRSLTVSGPPLKVQTFKDAKIWEFNFKSAPSTTGLRHHGYIRFFKPSGPKPLEKLECTLDCDCADYRYRWAWSNKQRGSSAVGPRSLNQALNRPPRVTNPLNKSGLCKHLLHLREYIYGAWSSFPAVDKAYSDKALDKLIRYAHNKWINMPAELEKARERDRRAAQVRAARNRGQEAPPPLATSVSDEPEQVSDNPATSATGNPSANPWTTAAPSASRNPLVQPERQGRQPVSRTGQRGESMQVLNVEDNMNQITEEIRGHVGKAKELTEQCLATYPCPTAPGQDQTAAPDEALSLLRQMVDLLQQLVPGDDDQPGDETETTPEGEVEVDSTAAELSPELAK